MAGGAVQFGKEFLAAFHLVVLSHEAIRLGPPNAWMLVRALREDLNLQWFFRESRSAPSDVIVIPALLLEELQGKGMLSGIERYGSTSLGSSMDTIVLHHQGMPEVKARTVVRIGGELMLA